MEANDLKKISLIRKYRFLKSDLDWKQVTLEDSREIFIEEVTKKVEDISNLMADPAIDNIQEKEEKEPKEKPNNNLKKLYRNISKVTHPDKDTENRYEETFKRASIAYKESNILELFEICDELDIEYEMLDEDIEFINKTLNSLQSQIDSICSTYIFKYMECVNEEEKNKIVDSFILNMKLNKIIKDKK